MQTIDLNSEKVNWQSVPNCDSVNFSGNDSKNVLSAKSTYGGKMATKATRLCTITLCMDNLVETFRQSVRILMDSGADCSFITKKCSKTFSLQTIRTSKLAIAAFGKNTEQREYNVVSTCLFGSDSTSRGGGMQINRNRQYY